VISVYFENRDFTPYIPQHWESLETKKYTKNAVWGCDRAYITAYGTETQLFEFVEMLRCPVYLSDTDRAERVWWGYVHAVDVHTEGGLVYGVSLNSMSNSVSVAHTYDHKRYTVDFATDSDSIDEYGQKDIQLQASDKSTLEATQLRDTKLQELKYPISVLTMGSPGNSFAVIECRGWHHTLDERYYSNDTGLEEYWDLNDYHGREIGEDNRPIAAQSFQLSSATGWTPTHIYLRVSKIGAPVDNLLVDLYDDDDSDTSPEDSLTGGATALDCATVNTYYEDTKFTIDTPPALSTETLYWIYITRSGAVDGDNHAMIGANKAKGYDNGQLKLKKGSSWITWTSRDSDLNFRIVREAATTTQISECITAVGGFYLGTTVVDASGINSLVYRDGDATAMYEIKKMMEAGTTNDRRLLSRTTDLRIFEVYEEPAKDSGDYFIDSWGNITDENDVPVPKSECTVAKWVRLKDVVPGSANVSKLAKPSPAFIESAEYNPIHDTYKFKTRSGKALLSLTGETG